MKWFLFILIFINLAFFAYHQFAGPQERISTPTLGPGEGGITLLAELNKENVELVVVAKPSPDPVTTTPVQTALKESCFEVEGFTTSEKAQAALGALINAGFTGHLASTEREELRGYWVMTDKFPTRKEALKVLREMHKLSIDSFIVRSGKNKNAISVGLFKRKRHANTRMQGVIKQGFNVSLKENIRKITDSRLIITYRGISTAPSPLTFIESGDSKITVNEKKCVKKVN